MKKIFLVLVTILLALTCTSVAALAEDCIGSVDENLNKIFDIEGLEVSSISIVADKESYMVVNGAIDEDTPWSGKYALTEEQYLALFHVNESVLVYENGKSEMTEETAKTVNEAINASLTNLDVELNFKPADFTRNIEYMGLGMLGIFVVVGVVILLTFVLNKVTAGKE